MRTDDVRLDGARVSTSPATSELAADGREQGGVFDTVAAHLAG
ncbi:hypothetical protein [Cellulomonas wangsupingiae]|nr:hypothetical protein [Cellulomonas wangsupingiae]